MIAKNSSVVSRSAPTLGTHLHVFGLKPLALGLKMWASLCHTLMNWVLVSLIHQGLFQHEPVFVYRFCFASFFFLRCFLHPEWPVRRQKTVAWILLSSVLIWSLCESRPLYKLRVPDQNSISQACYIVEIYHFGPEPSKLSLNLSSVKDSVAFFPTHSALIHIIQLCTCWISYASHGVLHSHSFKLYLQSCINHSASYSL